MREQEARTDRELLEAAGAGEEQAFRLLYERHRSWVLQVATRMLGDPEPAQDVLQETFLTLLRKLPGFTLTSQLRTWLYSVVRHACLASRRRTGRGGAVGGELPEPAAPEGRGSGMTDDLAALLAVLGPEHREVLVLRYVEGFSLAEAARALEIPVGTVKSRIHHALQRLRQDARTKKMLEE